MTQDLRYGRCLINIYGYKQITYKYRHHGSTNLQMLLSWGRAWWDMEIWGVSKERIILDSLSLISFRCGKIQIPQQRQFKEEILSGSQFKVLIDYYGEVKVVGN